MLQGYSTRCRSALTKQLVEAHYTFIALLQE